MKQLPFKRQLIILGCIIVALCVAIPVATFAKSAPGEPLVASKVTSHTLEAAPVSGGTLTSGKPVHGVVSLQQMASAIRSRLWSASM